MTEFTITKSGLIKAGILGFVIRGLASFCLNYTPIGWRTMFFPWKIGYAEFSGFGNAWLLPPNGEKVFYCLSASVFPGMLGAMIGMLAALANRLFTGVSIGALLSLFVVLSACLGSAPRSASHEFDEICSEVARLSAEAFMIGGLIGGLSNWIARRKKLPSQD